MESITDNVETVYSLESQVKARLSKLPVMQQIYEMEQIQRQYNQYDGEVWTDDEIKRRIFTRWLQRHSEVTS